MLTLKHRIMFRVYAFWALRSLKQPLVAELGALALLSVALAATVSVPSIIANMLGSGSPFGYLMMAFSHTNHLAQILLLITSLAALYVMVKNVITQKVFRLRFVRFA